MATGATRAFDVNAFEERSGPWLARAAVPFRRNPL
jgi:hypothetical protein